MPLEQLSLEFVAVDLRVLSVEFDGELVVVVDAHLRLVPSGFEDVLFSDDLLWTLTY